MRQLSRRNPTWHHSPATDVRLRNSRGTSLWPALRQCTARANQSIRCLSFKKS